MKSKLEISAPYQYSITISCTISNRPHMGFRFDMHIKKNPRDFYKLQISILCLGENYPVCTTENFVFKLTVHGAAFLGIYKELKKKNVRKHTTFMIRKTVAE